MVDQQRDTNEETLQPPAPEKFNEKIRRGCFWVVQYWRELFNFKFDKYMIIQVMPGVYGIALTAIAMGLLYLCVEAFMASTWRGIFYFFFAAPLTFLFAASVLRALLEFYMVVFKISEHVDELVGLRDTVDRLSGISDSVDEMVAVTRRIPFWRALSGGGARPARKTPKENDKEEKK
ncbi:DUF4282 domain-containing protein [Alcanivorax sp. VBW004]|uniref:DUF4282 domain-containing protein n=1 Tax=Alcanivorax sp. VBW004 TaxID=1287708 RepID=UPI0012BC3A41|nr:DUF4282 domain-containing protein [Alcanivorax sp. VBW004]MTT53899.1 DUF4282 domain-containing protein [Alcanivorax sp. VBW004]